MRRFVLSGVFVCALALSVFAGGTHQPGVDCPPPGEPQPEGCSDSSTATADGEDSTSTVSVIVDGVLLVISLLP